MTRGYTLFSENISKAVAILTALIAVLLTFADIGFLGIGTTELTTSLVVMLVSSYVIYFSLLDAGERLGRESEEYRSATERLRALTLRVRGDMLPALRAFCIDYCEAELGYRRRATLLSGGRSEEEYMAWLDGAVCDREAARVFKKAKHLTPISLSPTALLKVGGGTHDGELIDPTRGRLASLILKLIPTTLCTLFTASMLITAKDGLTVSVVIEGLVKLGCLPIIGLRGYLEGYRYAKEALVGWCESKACLLSAFLDSINKGGGLDASETDIVSCETVGLISSLG